MGLLSVIDTIVDIDGTVADCSHRLWFIEKKPKKFDDFHDNMKHDYPIWTIIKLVMAIRSSGGKIIYCTGRPNSHRQMTIDWLNWCDIGFNEYSPNTGVPFAHGLYMRATNDYRPDIVVKRELYDTILCDGFKPELVLEDRTRCVEMWRSLGLKTLQVAEANY